jgi:hypothetical protein
MSSLAEKRNNFLLKSSGKSNVATRVHIDDYCSCEHVNFPSVRVPLESGIPPETLRLYPAAIRVSVQHRSRVWSKQLRLVQGISRSLQFNASQEVRPLLKIRSEKW